MSRPSIYIVNPLPIPHFYNLEVFRDQIGVKLASFGELSVVTLAGMVPPEMSVRICDEQLTEIELNPPENYVALTGKSNQVQRTLELARHYRSIGKTVLVGGPYASLAPDYFEGECDILVTGEIEDIYKELFADLVSGNFKSRYVGGRADLRNAVMPRWDLYPNRRTASGTLQTSRGCPFSCEFCDVIQYAGQKQRHKETPQILAELNELYRHGYRQIFLADDNFTASRTRAKNLLRDLAIWNSRPGAERVIFFTQLSIDAVYDAEMLELAGKAGLHRAFVGIETVNQASLKETKKFQNLHGSLIENTEKLLRHGIGVYAGMIFGFDNDTLQTFEDQLNFLNESPIPAFSVGALIAYRSTPLYSRMVKEGRVDVEMGDSQFYPWETNLTLKNMSREEFVSGYRHFIKEVYSPKAFGQRMLRALELFGQDAPEIFKQKVPVTLAVGSKWFPTVIQKINELGPQESAMVERVLRKGAEHDLKIMSLGKYLYCYLQVRHMFQDVFEEDNVQPLSSPLSSLESSWSPGV